MPFMFCRRLRFRFYIFVSKYDQHVLKCLTVDGVYVPECLQCPFAQQGVKMVNFCLVCHYGLHFDHCVEQVLKKLKFLTLSVKCHGSGCDWSNRP